MSAEETPRVADEPSAATPVSPRQAAPIPEEGGLKRLDSMVAPSRPSAKATMADAAAAIQTLQSPLDAGAVQQACATIWSLAETADNRIPLRDQGAIEALIGAMASHVLDVEIQQRACGALWQLSICDACRAQLATRRAVGVLAGTMKAHPYVLHIQKAGTYTIGNVASIKGNQTTLRESGAVDAVTAAMANHDAISMQRAACNALSMLADGDSNISYMCFCGSMESLVIAWEKHPDDMAIARSVLLGLANISTCAQQHNAMAELGAVDAVMSILAEAPAADKEVTLMGLVALAHLSTDATRDFLTQKGVLELVLSKTRDDVSNVEIARSFCSTLANLSVTDGNKEAIPSAGGVDILLKCMKTHRADLEVGQTAITALLRLALLDANKTRLVDLGAVEILLDTMETHMGDKELQQRGCGTLWTVALKPDNLPQLRVTDAAVRLRAALDRYPDDATVADMAGRALDCLAGIAAPPPTTAGAAGSAPATGSARAEGIVMQGLLTKQGALFKGWRVRWMVLKENGTLSYSTKREDTSPKGIVQLAGYRAEACDAPAGSTRSHFHLIKTGQRTWSLSAEEEADRAAWVTAVNTVISRLPAAPATT